MNLITPMTHTSNTDWQGRDKNFRISYQTFFDVIFHLSIRKATMNPPRLLKLRKEYLISIG
jgi:hypothetical protein